MRAEEADDSLGPVLLDGLGDLAIVLQRRGAGINDDVVVTFGLLKAPFDVDVVRRAVHQLRVRHQRRRLRQPSRIPEAGDFAPRLVTRARAAIEAVKAGGREEESLHSV